MLKPAVPTSIVVLFLRSLGFAVGTILLLVIGSLAVLLAFPLSFERRYHISQPWNGFVIWWLRKTCKIDYRLSGLEHIPPGPTIVVAKHQSAWETIFLQQFLPPLAWVVKRELLWIPFFGWALALLHPIAIDRKATTFALKQVIRQGQERLAQGQWVLIFPEGTRTAPGSRQPYAASGALLAVNTGYPILPIAHNAGELWPRRGFFKYPGTIDLVFGPLITPSGRPAKVLNALVEQWIESTMQRISRVPEQPAENK